MKKQMNEHRIEYLTIIFFNTIETIENCPTYWLRLL